MTLEALIFDVDGTLADTEDVHRVCFNLAFEQFGFAWAWDRESYRELLRTSGGKERIARHIRHLPLSAADQAQALARVADIHAAKTRLYTERVQAGSIGLRPGVARLLDEAQQAGVKLAIATTTTAANVDALLTSTLGADAPDRFKVIACGDQVRLKKPAPDIYELALRTMGVEPDRAVAFEDSFNGLLSATEAGLWTVVTPTYWTDGEDFPQAGLVLPHLGDALHPLPHEPGKLLRDAAWLGLAELERLAMPASAGAQAPAAGARR